MRYPAILTKEGKYTSAVFPSCPGCQTQAGPGEDIAREAQDALQGWIEATLAHREPVPRPPTRARRGKVLWVDVPPKLAVKLLLRWTREDAGLSQRELAKRAGVKQPMIAQLEHPDYNPSVELLDRVARALGARLTLSLERAVTH